MTRRKKISGEVSNNLVSIFSAIDPAAALITDSVKLVLSIRDRLFIAKLEKFWRVFEESKIERDDFIKRTKEKNDWQKVGNNFLLVMDSFAAFDKSYYYGKSWIAWLKEEIDTNEFIEITNILQAVSTAILEKLRYDKRPWSAYDQGRIEACGIARITTGGFESPEEVHEIPDGPYSLSDLGKKLIKILRK